LKPALTSSEKWADCLAWGAACIRRPYDMDGLCPQGLPILHLYCLPSFDDAYAWTVYQTAFGNAPAFTLHTVFWRQAADGDRMMARHNATGIEALRLRHKPPSNEPDLETFTHPLETAWWNRQREKLQDIRFSVALHLIAGNDGTYYGLSLPDPFNLLALQWWEKGPDEWRELIAWADECMAFFRQLPPEQ
jgi:hypothetical protein